MIEVEVVNWSLESVVTTTIPESVSVSPSVFVVVHVDVKVVNGGGITDVVVVRDPSLPVVTITTPESVSTSPLPSVVVHVEVYVV